MKNNELRTKYEAEVRAYWNDDEMVKHVMRNVSEVVEMDNGELISIDKPDIETTFCYGVGMYGVSTDKEWDDARQMSETAKQDQDYFREQNIQSAGLMEIVRKLKGAISPCGADYVALISRPYYAQAADNKQYALTIYRSEIEADEEIEKNAEKRGMRRLTENEIERLIKAYEDAEAKFEKRLSTYLKRYGLSKVRSWTYLVD